MSGNDARPAIESELLRQRIRLYLYGELGFEERHEIERIRDEDPAFRELFRDEQEFLLSIGGADLGSDMDPLLEECRHGLDRAIAAERPLGRKRSLFARALSVPRRVSERFSERTVAWQALAAAALVLIGFFAGRGSTVRPSAPVVPGSTAVSGRPVSDARSRTFTGVEAVYFDPVSAAMQIVVEERRVVTGSSSDPVILGMLLDTVQESHAGAQLTSLDALRSHAADRGVREALLRTMLEDDDLGVRLKALEAVQEHAAHPDVRRALVQTLLRDPSAGMRVHAIQLLRNHADRDMAGPLQELIERETNPFVLQQSERILDSLGASMDRF